MTDLMLSPEQLLAQAPTAEGKASIAATAMSALGRRIKSDFVELAHYAHIVRRDALWAANHQSWDEFVDALNIEVSVKQMSLLANVWEQLVEKRGLPPAVVAELGSSKAVILLPSVRRGTLTDDLVEQAIEAPTVRKLQELVGHKLPERDATRESEVFCLTCGARVYGVRFVSQGAGERQAEAADEVADARTVPPSPGGADVLATSSSPASAPPRARATMLAWDEGMSPGGVVLDGPPPPNHSQTGTLRQGFLTADLLRMEREFTDTAGIPPRVVYLSRQVYDELLFPDSRLALSTILEKRADPTLGKLEVRLEG